MKKVLTPAQKIKIQNEILNIINESSESLSLDEKYVLELSKEDMTVLFFLFDEAEGTYDEYALLKSVIEARKKMWPNYLNFKEKIFNLFNKK